MQTDIAIIGGGIVGLATAYQVLCQRPSCRVVVLEKERDICQHQTGHNSGVLHSGIYYKPGSLKAITCRQGKSMLEVYCQQRGIAFERCGKLIVARDDSQVPALQRLLARGWENGVDCELLKAEQIREREPYVQGVQAIHVREAGIIDFVQVGKALADDVRQRGGEVRCACCTDGISLQSTQRILHTNCGDVTARTVINCAGLQSDRVARRLGVSPAARIIPFRGEYYALRDNARHLCRHLIYPVPDPRFPFLGVHFTRMIDGSVECGPNAVLALAREGYHFSQVNIVDLVDLLTYRGTWRMAWRYGRQGWMEWSRSISRRAFLKSAQRLIPALSLSDLTPAPAGVRAQAVLPTGEFVDDFVIDQRDRIIHVVNAPSPAATASLEIGRRIAAIACETLQA